MLLVNRLLLVRPFRCAILVWLLLNFTDITGKYLAKASYIPFLTPAELSLNYTTKLNFESTTKPFNFKISNHDLNNSILFAQGVVRSMKRLETNLKWSDIEVEDGTPSHARYIEFSPDRKAVDRGKEAYIGLKATLHLMNTFCLKNSLKRPECAEFITNFNFNNTPLEESCKHLNKKCSQADYLSTYSSLDGSCNNIKNGAKGEGFTGYSRLLPAKYLDGVFEPRRAVNKRPLPSPRFISSTLSKVDKDDDNKVTLAVMQWGQFVGHDLSRTATSVMIHTESSIECCDKSGSNLSPRYKHPFCSPVLVPLNDEFYSKHNLDCMTYVRSIPVLRSDCTLGALEQMNQATHFLDGSQLYGTTEKSLQLRSFNAGKLDITQIDDRPYLPFSDNPKQDCLKISPCFMSGDPRVNFQPQSTVLYTLWLREHNRIATKLLEINPSWDDEKLFQEARKIVIAEMQRITYKEFLPNLIGPKYSRKLDQKNQYDPNYDPAVSNSFATAALRALQSLTDGEIKLYDENRVLNSTINLQERSAIIVMPNKFDGILRGLATQKSRKLDIAISEDLRNNLYRDGKYGFDLLSLDIQRGRDHGLPPYASYRHLCGLALPQTFEDFSDYMTKQQINTLKLVYSHPRDVDLIVGGLMERPVTGSLLGPTFSCIITEQFVRTKVGDRFFYTHSFPEHKLKEIEKANLARIFCDNSNGGIGMIQPNVFGKISMTNHLVSCDSIPEINLQLWKD